MAKQTINIGTNANSKDGDIIRDAFNKVNQNFTELYSAVVDGINVAQVKSDWNATTGVAQILNKPTIPVDVSDLTDTTNLLGSGGTANTDVYKFQYGVIGTKDDPDTGGWGASAIVLDPGGESWAGMYIPSVSSQASDASLNIYNNKAAGNDINLTLYSGNFTFKGDGTLGFPVQPTNQRTGTGDALKFAKSGNQKVIATSKGTVESPTVERLVIAGGDSYRDPDTGVYTPYSEAGDIYLWAGRGANGGDIKVDAGNSQGVNGEEGGTIKVRGGYSTSGQGGFVEISAGYSNQGQGGDVSIEAGGGTTGGTINLYTYGNTQYNWQFKPDGTTQFPAGYTLPNTTGTPGQVLTLNEDNTVTWQNPGGDVDTNIWVEEFRTDTPLTDTAQVANSVEYDSQGNVYALMNIVTNNNNYYAVSKFDTYGVSQWHTRLEVGNSTDGWGLAIDNAGGYIYVAGRYNDGVYDKSTLTKLSTTNGSIVWSTTYDFGYSSNSPVVDVDADGNPVVVGYANNNISDQVTVTKISKTDGAVIWAQGLDGQGSEQAYGMAVGPAGEVVAIGYMSQLGLLDRAETVYADPVSNPNWTVGTGVLVGGVTFAVNFTDGVPTFTNIEDTVGGHSPDQVLGTINGDVLGGVTGVDDLTVKVGTMLPNTTDDRMLVAKYDSQGNVQWQKAVLFDTGYDCSGADADIDSLGNVYVCGQYYNADIGQTCMSLVKFDSNGAKQWSRRVVGNCQTLGTSVVVGPDDFLYLSGITGNYGTEDFTWVIAKYNQSGGVIWQRLLDNTTGWSFPGGLFFSNGGGSNIAVKDGYFAVSGGKSAVFGNDFRATVAQFDTAGTPVVLGTWDFKPATFSGVLNSGATDITVVDAAKESTDISGSITVATVSPGNDTSNFLIGTVINGNTVAVTGDITFSGIQIQGANTVNQNGSIELVPNPNLKGNGQYLNIYPTNAFDYPHIHIAAGTGGDLFVGDDTTYFSVGNDGNLKANTSGGQWQFGTDGNLTLPGNIDSVNSIGIQAGDAVTITSNNSVAAKTWAFDENGDLTVPGGIKTILSNNLSIETESLPTDPPATIVISGADFTPVNLTYIKDGVNSIWYPAGYIPGTDPYIEFTGGQYGIFVPGFGQALYVNTGTLNVPLAQWNTNPPLGSVAPTGVYTYPNTYTHTWTFGTDGAITASDAFTIKTPIGAPTSLANWVGNQLGGWDQPSYTNLATTGGTGSGLTVDVVGGGGYIDINAITINNPGRGYTTGDVITITNENNYSGTFTVVVGASANTWDFGTDGIITIPSNTRYPSTARGAIGDKAGMIVVAGAYLYHCYADYTDGSVPIWQKVAMDNTDWD